MNYNEMYEYSKQKMNAEELIILLKWYLEADKEEIPISILQKINNNIDDLHILLKTTKKAFYLKGGK